MKIGIITKHTIAERREYVEKLVEALVKSKQEIIFDEHTGPLFKRHGYNKAQVLSRADMVIVLGGDGTLLKTARNMPKKTTLIAGVNLGNLGFLTEFTPENLFKNLPKILEGDYHLDERYLLRATVYRNGKKLHTALALNEVVVNQGGFARLISLHVQVDKREMALYRADGLIIATPTGSTGHSLSAGGPILHPGIAGILVTPLCPSKLGMRPIIIPNDRNISISLETEWRAEKKPVVLTIDGQLTFNLHRGDTIKIRKSSRAFTMIRMKGHNYYRMLRKKLRWGE